MNNIVGILISINSTGILALAVILGRYMQRVDQLERRSEKTDGTGEKLAAMSERLTGVERAVENIREDIKQFAMRFFNRVREAQ